jgi:flagellar hook-associated protein 2
LTLSVDGLISGLDTTALINQLMALERQPVVRLESRRDQVSEVVDLYRNLNTRFDAVEEAASKLAEATAWSVSTASSSDEDVATVTTTGSATPSSFTFEVVSLAKAHTVIGANSVADPATDVVATQPFTIGTTTISDFGGGTMDEVADAINASDAGVLATVVEVAPGQHRLQLTAETTGAASAFTVTGLGALGTFGVVSQGADATLTVGDGPAAYTVVSSTNVFDGVIPGVTITAQGPGTVTVEVARDDEAIADRVEAFVNAINDATGLIRQNATYDPASQRAGLLLSDSTTDLLRRALTDAVTRTVVDGMLAGEVGIEMDRDGVLSFDREAFIAALQDDPEAVQRFFGESDPASTTDDGIAERVRLVAEEATRFGTGQIDVAIAQRTSRLDMLEDQIESYERRLALREAQLRRKFAGLESALSSLRNQGSWLSGAIASLPSLPTS